MQQFEQFCPLLTNRDHDQERHADDIYQDEPAGGGG
jgi:hypothetical protein